jgi:predicted Zn-dependent protease
LHKYDDAAVPLERVLALDPSNPEALFLLADIATIKGDPARATRMSERVLADDPKNPEANLIRGTVLADRGSYEEARRALELAASGDPDNPRIFSQLSRAYAQLGDNARAASARNALERATRRSKQSQRQLHQLLDFSSSRSEPAAKNSATKP